MKLLSLICIVTLLLSTSCNSNEDESSETTLNVQEQDNQEVKTPDNTFERFKKGEKRFVVIRSFNFMNILAYKELNDRMYGKVIFDTKTDVIEVRTSNKNGVDSNSQYKIIELVNSDNTYEEYKISSLESNNPETMVLVDNAVIFGRYPAKLKSNGWIMYYDIDFKYANQVYEDLDHYFDQIEDISFEVK